MRRELSRAAVYADLEKQIRNPQGPHKYAYMNHQTKMCRSCNTRFCEGRGGQCLGVWQEQQLRDLNARTGDYEKIFAQCTVD